MRMNLTQAAQAMQAESGNLPDISGLAGPGEDILLTGATMDSRVVRPGDLFFCLPGARVDGHDFAVRAVQGGAVAVVASRELQEVQSSVPVLLVRDTIRALGELARAWRRTCSAQVVGVTGSAGKTTVKEMLARVCSEAGKTCKNPLNRNNQIGMPLSLLACEGTERFWVMEAGISRPGDMDDLGRILRPDLAVVINAGPAHLEALGSVQGVARAKASLLAHLPPGKSALVNRDCPQLWAEAEKLLPGVHGFSVLDRDAEFFGSRLPTDDPGVVRMELVLRKTRLKVQWPVHEAPYLENVLAVAGAAMLLGLDIESIRQGVAAYQNRQGRFQVQHRGGWLLIDDTYNANPLSMTASLARSRELAKNGPLVCVLGDMLELGAEAESAHRMLGRDLDQAGCAAVLYHGVHAPDVLEGLEAAGWQGSFAEVRTPDDFQAQWQKLQKMHGTALFKGSRGGAMETFLAVLTTETTS